ncbi:MAG: extradiol ring-cleavage dioxygenase [Alicyclobacillus sp.]|nr:extradiol ring-cleavage dioxygenase [Alicyclobacillus sp.]
MADPFVFACIAPHGLPVIEALSPRDPELMATTRSSMQKLGIWMKEARPETIVVLTPHGLRIDGAFTVIDASHMSGEMSEHTLAGMSGEALPLPGNVVGMHRLVDRQLARQVVESAAGRGIPVAAANFATSEGPFSNLPLDWGAMIPLYFMPDTPVVVVTPSRRLSDTDHLRFGAALADAVRQSGKRVGLIASCDWSHAHHPTGPYGFHEDAAWLDEQVVQLLKTNEIEAMQQFSPERVANAKPDGIWQALILAGAIAKEHRHVEFLSYEVPTYFGLMCVAYHGSPRG